MRHHLYVFSDDLPALRRLHFTVTAKTNLSLLLGGSHGRPRLICEDESSGWGADAIELDISVDGRDLRYINNDEIGDMEHDAVRVLDQWIPAFVFCRLCLGFRVIELDDGVRTISARRHCRRSRLAADPGIFVISRTDPNSNIRGTLHVNVDDGTYDVQVTAATWDQQF